MNKPWVIFMIPVLFATISFAQLQTDFSKKGSKWLGGGFNFSSIGIEDERLNMLQASPILRFFPADHLMVGPSISWTGIFVDSENINQFGFGAEIGGVFENNGKSFYYIRSSLNVIILGGTGENISGFSLPIAGGVIIPIGKIFAVQIEPSFTFTQLEDANMNIFNLNIGICGIGEKSAVSVMQNTLGITSLF